MSAHQRLRPFRTASGNEACMAVRAGDRLFLGGQTGLAPDGSFTGLGDPAAQAAQAMRNVTSLLEEAGAGVEQIRKITIYLTDRAWQGEVEAAIARHLDAVAPARTVLIVAGLARPEMLVAVDVDAVIPP